MLPMTLTEALAGLGAIALGLGGLFYAGRDRTADEHDLADYHPARPVPVRLTADVTPYVAATRRKWPLVDVDTRPAGRRALRADAALALAVPVDSAVTPPLARRMLVEHAVPTLSDAAVRGIADEWLREIAADERAKDGIGPDGHAWQLDGSCWADCPGCAYDMTGAFPVVRAA